MNVHVNIPLLRKAVEWAEAEAAKPAELREWDQRFWITPASATDPNLNLDGDDGWFPWGLAISYREGLSEQCGTAYCIAGYIDSLDGPVRYPGIPERASEKLGIDEYQAAELFDSANDIEKVREVAERIAGERL